MKAYARPEYFCVLTDVRIALNASHTTVAISYGSWYTTLSVNDGQISPAGEVSNFRLFGYQSAVDGGLITQKEADNMQRAADDLLHVDEAVIHEAALRRAAALLSKCAPETDPHAVSDALQAIDYFARSRRS